MSNIVHLRVPQARARFADRTDALSAIFAKHRRAPDDVFWLKENAEFLNICECTGTPLSEDALDNWSEFYASLPKRLSFFPQYYRFFLSIALDLEALGIDGDQAERACRWVAEEGFADAELSDLQRAEAHRLLARRGFGVSDPDLDARLRAFIGRPVTFAMPNKKAAYELTHIVFYLSEYGRRDPQVPEAGLRSLEYAGLLAVLEQNMDLLAEVCVALRYAGKTPSPLWEAQVRKDLNAYSVETGEVALTDDYHAHLVSCWSSLLAGDTATSAVVFPERTRFVGPTSDGAPLRVLSHAMLDLDRARSGDWQAMRPMLFGLVGLEGQRVLEAAEQSSSCFDEFFQGFARVRA